MIFDDVRWVMVWKKKVDQPTSDPVIPELSGAVAATELLVPAGLDLAAKDTTGAESPDLWNNFEARERIDHADGMTIEVA